MQWSRSSYSTFSLINLILRIINWKNIFWYLNFLEFAVTDLKKSWYEGARMETLSSAEHFFFDAEIKCVESQLKNCSTFLKRTELSKRLSTIIAGKRCNQRKASNVSKESLLSIVTPKIFSWLLYFSVISLHSRSNCSFSLTPNNMKWHFPGFSTI